MELVVTSHGRQRHRDEFDTEMGDRKMEEEGLPDDYQQLEQGQKSVDRPTSTEDQDPSQYRSFKSRCCYRWKGIGNLS